MYITYDVLTPTNEDSLNKEILKWDTNTENKGPFLNLVVYWYLSPIMRPNMSQICQSWIS